MLKEASTAMPRAVTHSHAKKTIKANDTACLNKPFDVCYELDF